MLGPGKSPSYSCAFERGWREKEITQILEAVDDPLSYKPQGRLAQGVRVIHTAERLASVGRIREALDLLERAGAVRLAQDPRSSPAWSHRSTHSAKFRAVYHQTKLMAHATLAQLQSATGDVEGAERSRRAAVGNLSASRGFGNPGEMRTYVALAEASAT
jgi:hypothetical protein